ncbi:MAG: hypothetical protein NT062_28045 [Proteobacteria bacterium]|nr:hypothetical protein [Pseudomonadota bacterium]
MFAFATLFSPRRPDPKLRPYRDEVAALDAVAAGKKAMLFTSYTPGARFTALVRAATARGLAVTLHDPDGSEPNVYVLPLDQTWRIAALDALRETALVDGNWTLASEALESLLLGYTAAQRARWIEAFRARQAAFSCQTVYALLTREQRDAVTALGHRCFGSPVGLTLFFHTGEYDVRADAAKRIPKGHTLARVGFDWDVVDALFADKSGIATATITPRTAARAAAAIRSNVQLLTGARWK